MCKRFVLASDLDKIESKFNVRLDRSTLVIPKSYSITCGDSTYVITTQNPHDLQMIKFGMTPYFCKEPLNTINARAEGDKNRNNDPSYNGSNAIFLKAAFKKPIQSQRCIIIADAYYEWSDKNIPYLVYLQNKERPFGFAGIYDHWKNPETNEIVTGFAIITTTANSMLQSIGFKRMPVILPYSNSMDWVKSSKHLTDVLNKLYPFPSDQMNAYPVSDLVNMPDANEPSMLNPVGAKLQTEYQSTNITRHRYYHKEKPEPTTPWYQNWVSEKL